MCAQYTAVSGRAFLGAVAAREAKNPQFDFLKPTHWLFEYFTALVDAYSRVLAPSKDTRARLAAAVTDDGSVLDRIAARYEYERVTNEARVSAAESAESERAAFQSIDWNDFVVVEAIDFTDADFVAAAPPPIVPVVPAPAPAHSAWAAALHAQAAAASAAAAAAAATGGGGGGGGGDDMDVDMEVEDEAPINVAADYVPRVRTAAGAKQATHFTDPRTGKSIPITEISEHMRIELMDPKWREERARALAKRSDSATVSGDAIGANLRRFAAQKPDVFGGEEEEEEEEKRKAAVAAAAARAAVSGSAGGGWGSLKAVRARARVQGEATVYENPFSLSRSSSTPRLG